VYVRLQRQRHARINTLVAAPLTLPVAAMPKTRSPLRSPNRKFDWVEHSPTQLTRVALNRSAPPASGDFGVNGIHRVRTAWIVVNHRVANGIQEVVGSIPIGSTSEFTATLRAAFLLVGPVLDLTFGYSRPKSTVTPGFVLVQWPRTKPATAHPKAKPDPALENRDLRSLDPPCHRTSGKGLATP
jgi:hypothetical protein